MSFNKTKIRRSMLFMNCQRPNLLKDAYIYGADCIIMDLEDAVAENQKDAARYSLYHALKEVDYRGVERVVRINALDTPHWREDVRVAVAGGADIIRISKTETPDDVKQVAAAITEDEKEFGQEAGSIMIMCALESAKAVLNAYEISLADPRMMGIALSAGDFTRDIHTTISGTGVELAGARQHLVLAARAAGIQVFDTVYPDIDNDEGLRRETELIKTMGFDGKSLIHPRQVQIVHDVYAPSAKEIDKARRIILEVEEQKAQGVGVFVIDGNMIDIAFYEGAQRTMELAKVSGLVD